MRTLLADPGKAGGCSTTTSVINSFIHLLILKFSESLWGSHAFMVEDRAFSHKIDYVPISKENLNRAGHLNHFIGSKVTAILVNGGILPMGGVASGKVCPAACAACLFLNIPWC